MGRKGPRGERKGGFGGMCMATELETPGSLPGLGGDRAHQSASPRTRSVSPSNKQLGSSSGSLAMRIDLPSDPNQGHVWRRGLVRRKVWRGSPECGGSIASPRGGFRGS